MTYDPKENEKYHNKKLPPEWWSKFENFFTFNWRLLFALLLLAFYFVFAFFVDDSSDSDDPPSPYDFTSR